MNKIILSLVILCVGTVSVSIGQTTQQGIVEEYRETHKKQPLGGVELLVTNAPSTVSDKKGRYLLEFQTMQPGQRVNIRRIEKLGYEIFNKEALEQWNINPDMPFTIVMVRSDLFKKIRDNYERVSSKSYADQFEKEKRQLEAERQAGRLTEERYRVEYIKLREEYDRKLENIDNYVDRFARIDLTELTKQEQEIISLVNNGEIDEAINRYEQLNLLDSYSQIVRSINDLQSAEQTIKKRISNAENEKKVLLQQLQREINLLQLRGGRTSFKRIEEKYEKLIEIDSINIVLLNDYLSFCTNQKKLQKAIVIAQKILPQTDDIVHQAQVRTVLGAIFYEKALYQQAEHELKEALNLVLPLIETGDTSTLLMDLLAMIYNNIGCMYDKLRDFAKAEQYHLLADKVRESLYSEQPQRFVTPYVSTKLNLANVYFNTIQHQKGFVVCEEAVAILEKIENKSDRDREQLADIYQGMTTGYLGIYDYANAEKYALLSTKLFQELYEGNPNRYSDGFAMSLGYLALSYAELHKYAEAENFFVRAQDIYTAPENNITNEMLMHQVTLYTNWGNLYIHMQRLDDAIALYRKALQTCDKMGEVMLYASTTIMNNLASIQMFAGKFKDAEQQYLKTVDILLRLSETNPRNYCVELGRTLCNLGILYSQHMRDHDTARNYFSQAVETLLFAVKINPNYIVLLNQTYNSLAYSYAYSNDFIKAVDTIDLCIASMPHESNYYDSKGEILLLKGDIEGAKQMWKRVIELAPNFLETHQSTLYDRLREIGEVE